MSDPKRLLHGAGGPLAMDLLAAGCEEQPSDAALQRALERAALAAGVAATVSHSTLASAHVASPATHGAVQGTGASTAAASGSASTGAAGVSGAVQSAAVAGGAAKLGVSVATLTKWVGIAAVGVGVSRAAPAALRWLEPREGSLPARSVVHEVSAGAPVLAVEAMAAVEAAPRPPAAGAALALDATKPPETQEPPSMPRARARVRAPARSALEELRLVDGARQALQSGDARRALDLLEHYESRIAEPQFELEVGVLRMDALDRLGRAGAAQRQARQLLTRSLPEPQAARARAILDRR